MESVRIGREIFYKEKINIGTRIFLTVILITTFLMNTSIYNTEDFGIPIFWVSVPLLLAFVGLRKINVLHIKPLLFFLTLVILLIISIMLHIAFGAEIAKELNQLVSRGFLLLFFILNFIFLSRVNADLIYRYSKNFIKIFIIYGLYQFIANNLGFPAFLDFLRNNSSFVNASSNAGGWLETFRIYSIWSEPSFSAIPVGFFLYLLFFYRKNNKELLMWLIITLVYSYFTYSRLTWMVAAATIGSYVIYILISKFNKKFFNWFLKRAKVVIILIFLLFSFSWVYLAPIIMDDLSSLSRSSSIIIAVRIFLDNILIGSGMNTYEELQFLYNYDLAYFEPTPLSHNLFTSYAQQMGIIGIILSVLPILFMLSLKNIDIHERLVLTIMFVTIGTYGFDLFYMPLSWFIVALLSAVNFNKNRLLNNKNLK